MADSVNDKQRKDIYRNMTVAHIRESKRDNYVEVVFLESARFYRLPRENPNYDEALRRLREAVATGRVLKVRFAAPHSDIIEAIQGYGSDAPKRNG